jgi:hypothetical protein
MYHKELKNLWEYRNVDLLCCTCAQRFKEIGIENRILLLGVLNYIVVNTNLDEIHGIISSIEKINEVLRVELRNDSIEYTDEDVNGFYFKNEIDEFRLHYSSNRGIVLRLHRDLFFQRTGQLITFEELARSDINKFFSVSYSLFKGGDSIVGRINKWLIHIFLPKMFHHISGVVERNKSYSAYISRDILKLFL